MKTKPNRSLVIINKPCTSKPLSNCGPIPLNNNADRPSYSIMCAMTSEKERKGLPFRTGGGWDCRPTLATIRGWVRMVARDLERAPRTLY